MVDDFISPFKIGNYNVTYYNWVLINVGSQLKGRK